MKKIILTFIFSFSLLVYTLGQERDIYRLSNGAIVTNSEFLDLNLYSKSVYNYKYKYDIEPLSVRVGEKQYDIKLANYVSYWEDADSMFLYDAGDFNVVEFIGDDGFGYQYRDDMGILKMNPTSVLWNPGYYGASYKLRNKSKNGYFVEVPLTSTSKAVVFFGQSYSTGEGRTFIFIVTERDVRLVFNMQYNANSIDIGEGTFEMNVESKGSQLLTMNPDIWSDPVTHTIWLEDGVLKFRDN